jgi:hypothetical protein
MRSAINTQSYQYNMNCSIVIIPSRPVRIHIKHKMKHTTIQLVIKLIFNLKKNKFHCILTTLS